MVAPKWLSMLMASAVTLVAVSVGSAQTVPNDVLNPASDAGIPALLTAQTPLFAHKTWRCCNTMRCWTRPTERTPLS